MRKETKEALLLVVGSTLAATLACSTNINSQIPPSETSTKTTTPDSDKTFEAAVNTAVAATGTRQIEQTLIAKGQFTPIASTEAPKTETPVAQAPTQEPPTSVPVVPSETATSTEIPISILPIIPQELNANNFREAAQTESQVWQRIIANLKTDYANKDALRGTNSLLTTLTNKPLTSNPVVNFGSFGSDPKTEPGVWQTPSDFDNYRDLYTIDPSTKVLDLFHKNENGIGTIGIYGRADDRDVEAYYEAAGLVALKHPTDFANTTIADLNAGKYPSQFEDEIAQTQNSIFARIQRNFLIMSPEEAERRTSKSDASSQIPEKFRKVDQYQSCDVYMWRAKIREAQKQALRFVSHKDGSANTFTTSNVGAEGALITISVDPNTTIWGVRSITNRFYPTDLYNKNVVYINQAAGEQELPCGQGQAVTPENQSQPGQGGKPNQSETSVPTVTPFKPNSPGSAPTPTQVTQGGYVPPTLIPATNVPTEMPHTAIPAPTNVATPVQFGFNAPTNEHVNLGSVGMVPVMLGAMAARYAIRKVKAFRKNK